MESKNAPLATVHSGLARPKSLVFSSRTHKPSPLRYATAYSTSSTSLSTSDSPHQSVAIEEKPSKDAERVAILTLTPRTAGKTRSFPRSILMHTQVTSNNSDGTPPSDVNAEVITLTESRDHSPPPTPRNSGETKVKGNGHSPLSHLQWHTAADSKAQTGFGDCRQRRVSFLPSQLQQQQQQQQRELQFHPILLYTRHETTAYDVSQPPSHHAFIDRRSRASISIPKHTLSHSATKPHTNKPIVLRSNVFPWTILAISSSSEGERTPDSKTSSVKPCLNDPPVTNLDVLSAVHTTLAARVDPQEWAALGHGSRTQRRIMQEYERRCVRTGGGWDEGVRRIDYLCGKTLLMGIELEKASDKYGLVGKLLFTNA